MEFRTRCRLIPALFTLTFCAVPALAQDEPNEPIPATGYPAPLDPTEGQNPFSQVPGTPGGQLAQPRYGNAFGQGGGYNPGAPPGFGQPAMALNPVMMQSPEMAKKMRAIMVLRQMWQLRLTARDISAILPPLRELADAEKNLQARSERILEDERRALLTADPDSDPPEGSGDLMQREHELFRIKSDDIWRAIDKSIGRGKANGVRQFLGMGGQMGFPNPGGDTPPNTGGFQPRAGGAGLGGNTPSGGGRGGGLGGDAPFAGGGAFGGGGGGTGLGAPSADNPVQPAPGFDPARRPRQNRARGGGADGFSGAPTPGVGQGLASPGGSPSRNSAPLAQNNLYNAPGMPGTGGGMPMMPPLRVSITEFVSLLGEKLAAMRK